jgi:hypothetical protein
MPSNMPTSMSSLFRDPEAESKVIGLMSGSPAQLWSVSEFTRQTGLTRQRIDRCVTALEAKGLVEASQIGRVRAIQWRGNGRSPPAPSAEVPGDGIEGERSETSPRELTTPEMKARGRRGTSPR